MSDIESAKHVVYQVLYARYQSNTDILWRVIAFSLAGEASIWVALVNGSVSTAGSVLLGLGLLLLSVAGPQTTRFIENLIFIDRQKLDFFERELLPGLENFHLQHGLRSEDRTAAHMASLADGTPEREAFLLRRIYKQDGNKVLRTLNRLLDQVGKPSIVWTAVMATVGAAGVMAASIDKVGILWLEILLDLFAGSLIAVLWVIANEWHRQFARSLKKVVRKICMH